MTPSDAASPTLSNARASRCSHSSAIERRLPAGCAERKALSRTDHPICTAAYRRLSAVATTQRDALSMSSPDGYTFTAEPRELAPEAWLHAQWSVYLMRFDLRSLAPALKIGMVGSGTVGTRLQSHLRQFGPAEVLSVWTVADAAEQLHEVAKWRLTEQYEARLQFAPEFLHPSARLRRLRPDTQVYSYEWFEDDHRVIDAVRRWALSPVTLPLGWEFATEDPLDPAIRDQPRS